MVPDARRFEFPVLRTQSDIRLVEFKFEGNSR
jgi:hypothetical protein